MQPSKPVENWWPMRLEETVARSHPSPRRVVNKTRKFPRTQPLVDSEAQDIYCE
ncbi:uncharacterized protein FRV6_04882 [Fusarium oxysporum]|uniref:Uncharacterized protein n=1 Tax=Fusarium oxysporum TaxID=5507 RepID=A0A2H3SZH6_FUSOX|nr:uncharacterized protein FRV6_04882 [Fusarium oxysporum]